ncbi:MAG: CotH kinase family protein, partial [Planctomycetota bacterium]
TFVGSDWPDGAEGSGHTVELAHPNLDNRYGGAWRLGPLGGTPGEVNAAFDMTAPPVIGRVRHSPAIPTSIDDVVVTCRVSSVDGVSSVRLLWELDGTNESGALAMQDDGLSGDGEAGDGVFGVTISPQVHRAVVAFRIEATSPDSQAVVPRNPPVDPYPGFEGARFLYQVLDGAARSGSRPSYFIVLRDSDSVELERRDEESNVLLYASFVARHRGVEEVHHLCGLRFRGSNSRGDDPKSYRVEFPRERPFQGSARLNLNAQDSDREILAADLFRRAGLPAPQDWLATVTFNGTSIPTYVRKERLDSLFLERYFGDASDGGNLYRGLDPGGELEDEADLSYLGPDRESYRPYYAKRTNREEDDHEEVVELCRAFDPDETPDEAFVEAVERMVNVTQWARFFAVQSCIANEDGGIQRNRGEDYFLYRVPSDSPRSDAGKWLLIPWDIEEGFDDDSEPLFRPSVPAIRRFLTHPKFAPIYYCQLVNLREGVFSRREFRQRFRLIDEVFDFGDIDSIDANNTARLGFYDENIPRQLTSGVEAGEGKLVSRGSMARFFRGLAEPSGGTLEWTTLDFDDSNWEEGPSGFGYGDGDDATLLADMEDAYTSVYVRHEFDVSDPAAIQRLELLVDYDDGFIAYLNGVELARDEMGDPESFVEFNAVAEGLHEAGDPETFDVSEFVDRLQAGRNVLALHGANEDLGSSDFSLAAELSDAGAGVKSAGCGSFLMATSEFVRLTGRADGCSTFRVTVAGVEADYDPVAARWFADLPITMGGNTVTIESFDVLGQVTESIDVEIERIVGPFRVLSGELAGDRSLTEAESPYFLSADLTVPSGVRLNVEPGTRVFGRNGASIIVEGEFVAQGTEQNPVVFRSLTCENRWGGIAMEGTGADPASFRHVLRFCDIEYGNNPSGFEGCVAPVNARALVDRCSFRHLTTNAIDVTDGDLEVRDCLFETIHEGVHGTNSTVVILHSTFRGMIGDKDAVDFDGNGVDRSRIEGCLFVDGSDDGIDLGDTTVDIVDNVFIDIQDKALSLEDNGPIGPPTIVGNLIVNCGTAIALKNGVTIEEGHHNTLVGNQEGINLFAKDGASDGGHGMFHSTIVWKNNVDVRADSLSSISLTYSNVSEGLFPGEGNISSDPLFDAEYQLLPGSPCIGTGRDGSDMGAFPFAGVPLNFVRADADGNGTVNVSDAITSLGVLFQGREPPSCYDRYDANDDGFVDLSDPVFTLLFLFAGGSDPAAPFPDPGMDPSDDALSCF